MPPSQAPPTTECRMLADAYAALNRNDLDGFVRCFDPQVERIEPPGCPTAGIFRGVEAVKAHVARGRGTWAEGGCEPVSYTVAGDRVVVVVHVRVRLVGATDWIDGRLGDVFTFRDGKVVQFRTFWECRDAIEFAGAGATDPGSNG